MTKHSTAVGIFFANGMRPRLRYVRLAQPPAQDDPGKPGFGLRGVRYRAHLTPPGMATSRPGVRAAARPGGEKPNHARATAGELPRALRPRPRGRYVLVFTSPWPRAKRSGLRLARQFTEGRRPIAHAPTAHVTWAAQHTNLQHAGSSPQPC